MGSPRERLARQPSGRRPRAGRHLGDDAAARSLTNRSIDWAGAALLGLGSTSLLLGLVWGGRDYPWAPAHVIGALAAAGLVYAVFGLWERRVPETILRFEL